LTLWVGVKELKVIDVTLTKYSEDTASVEEATKKTEHSRTDENTHQNVTRSKHGTPFAAPQSVSHADRVAGNLIDSLTSKTENKKLDDAHVCFRKSLTTDMKKV
jgi:hypothetical protein